MIPAGPSIVSSLEQEETDTHLRNGAGVAPPSRGPKPELTDGKPCLSVFVAICPWVSLFLSSPLSPFRRQRGQGKRSARHCFFLLPLALVICGKPPLASIPPKSRSLSLFLALFFVTASRIVPLGRPPQPPAAPALISGESERIKKIKKDSLDFVSHLGAHSLPPSRCRLLQLTYLASYFK